MSTQATIAEILPRAEQAIQHLIQMVTAMPPALIEEPLLGEGRSVKDVLGHLTWWDQWLLVTLPPAASESAPIIRLPLADQIPSSDGWTNEMNAKVLAYNKSREFPVIWAELKTTCDLLLQRVAQLSDQDLYDPNGMAASIGTPVAPLIYGIYEHYEEHAHEFEQIKA